MHEERDTAMYYLNDAKRYIDGLGNGLSYREQEKPNHRYTVLIVSKDGTDCIEYVWRNFTGRNLTTGKSLVGKNSVYEAIKNL